MGIDIQRTAYFDELSKKALEEYFTYDAKIKNGKDIVRIIDKIIIPKAVESICKEQSNGKS